jgi:hypothetical protein
MLREDLIREISYPPPIRISKRLRSVLAEQSPVEVPCLAADCFNVFTPKWVWNKKQRRRVYTEYCSRTCAAAEMFRRVSQTGGRVAGEKRRGKNPNRHILKRVNGKLVYLHRHIVETENAYIDPDCVIHHRDERKHHNCYASQSCNDCAFRLVLFVAAACAGLSDIPALSLACLYGRYGCTNLEILTGEAAKKHLDYHRGVNGRARRRK